jgi:hypothetical protein
VNRFRLWISLAAASLVLSPLPALAQITLGVSATAQTEYNSNVFDLEPGFTFFGLGRSPRMADADQTYSAAANLKGQWRRQTLYADATGSRINYDYYTELNHETYKFDAGWNGMLGRVFDGNFEVIRNRSMVPFLYVFQSSLSLSTEQREQGGVGFQFLPRWRFEASGYTHTVTWPLPGNPDLQVHESEGDAALKYVGTAGFTSGLSGGYLKGNFTGSLNPALNPAYHQWTANYVANEMTGRSSLSAQAGYTRRTSLGARALQNNLSAVTGALNYTNQITGRSSVTVILARNISTYITNSGSEIDNSATLEGTWQATFKTGFTGSYVWDYAELPGQSNSPGSTDRLDHVQTLTAQITYQALRLLGVKGYASYQRRTSNYIGGDFDAWIVGASVTLSWQSM